MEILSRSASFIRRKAHLLPKLGAGLILLGGVPLTKVKAVADLLNQPNLDQKVLSELVKKLKNSLNPKELKQLITKLEEFAQHKADGTFSPSEIKMKQQAVLNDCNNFVNVGLNSVAAIYVSSTAILLLGLYFAIQEVKSLDNKTQQLAIDINRKINKCSEMINDLDSNKHIFNKSTLDNYNELINDVLSLKNRVENALSESKRKKAYMAIGALGGLALTGIGGAVFYNTAISGTVGLTLATGTIGICTIINGIAMIKFGCLYFEVDKLKNDLELLNNNLDQLLEKLTNNELIVYDENSGGYIIGNVINNLKENSKQYWDENGNIDEQKINDLENENNRLKNQLQMASAMNNISMEQYQQFIAWQKQQSQGTSNAQQNGQ